MSACSDQRGSTSIGQSCNDEYPSKNSKNVDFDCIMNAFFDERNYFKVPSQSTTAWTEGRFLSRAYYC